MALWDKVRQEIDKAGHAARELLDEGKLRIEAYRARERADEAAAALGYAWFRSGGGDGALAPDVRERLWNALTLQDAEARRLEAALEAARQAGATPVGTQTPTPAATHQHAASDPSATAAAGPAA
jgi:hypothetical protein